MLDIPIAWEYVRNVRQQVEAALAGYTEEVSSAAVMTASELVENAIKYGAVVPTLPCARFTFRATPEYVLIEVSNGLREDRSYELLQNMVHQMKSEEVCGQLYMTRLQELINNPLQANRLGLYRIGYEGKFRLECSYANQILTMTARRDIQ